MYPSRDAAATRLNAAFYGALRASGATSLRRRLQRSGPILCYHNVVSSSQPAAGDQSLHLSVDRFERQMRWLSAHYQIVPLAELVTSVQQRQSLRRAAAVTFDDAYQGVFENAVPVLRLLGIPATVFVVTSAPGKDASFWWDEPEVAASVSSERRRRWLTALRGDGPAILAEVGGRDGHAALPSTHRPASWETISRHAGNGIDLGVHSATHRSMPALDDDELDFEIAKSRDVLLRATGTRASLFAYPYGLSDARSERFVRDCGYTAGLGLDPRRRAGRPSELWSLGRLNIPSSISDAAFEAWTTGFHARARQ